jgi:hypothetical protein
MNAVEGLGVAMVGIGTLPVAAALARCALGALFNSMSKRERAWAAGADAPVDEDRMAAAFQTAIALAHAGK